MSTLNAPWIFLVEDSRDLRDLIKLVLEPEGYRVECAENGLEALEKLRGDFAGFPPALILLDLMMPVMDGGRFREEQLTDPKLAAIPVCVMTADARGSQKAKSMCVAAYFLKPVSIDKLLSLARKYCGDGSP